MIVEKDYQSAIEEIHNILDRLSPADDGTITVQGEAGLDKAIKTLSYARNRLKRRMEKMDVRSPLTQKYILDYFYLYLDICSTRGRCRQQLASSKKMKNPNDKGNDGSGKQHWIPSCYINNFSDKNNELSWWTYEDIAAGIKQAPVNHNGPFREIEDHKGSHYPHDTELILADFETDYGVIMEKNRYNLDCAWNHMIISLFFYILSIRTWEQKKKVNPSFEQLINNNFRGAHVYMQNHTISLVDIKELLPPTSRSSKITAFITQDPVLSGTIVGFGEVIIAPYDLQHLIVIKQGFSDNLFKGEQELDWHELLLTFLQTKMEETTTYEDKYIYTDTKSSPFRIMTAEFAEQNPLPNMVK